MGYKPLPNEKTVEELLNILESSKDTDESKSSVQATDDLLSFISYFNIKPGVNKVHNKVLFELYKSWSKNPVPKKKFWFSMPKYFTIHKTSTRYYYEINLDAISVAKTTLKYLQDRKVDKVKYPSWQKHFADFINYYNIKKGNVWLEGYVLFYYYDKWNYHNKRKMKLSSINFLNFCKLHFEYKIHYKKESYYFSVNKEFLDNYISQEKLNSLRQARENKNAKRKKSKSKVPSVKT